MSLRGIGSRSGATPVERINRDGGMEVLEPEDVEITPRERIAWYSKAKIDQRGRTPEEIFGSEKNEDGNPMEISDKVRTRLPRKHQLSTETRLLELRGEDTEFQTSEADTVRVNGLIPEAKALGKKEKATAMCRAFEKVATTLASNNVLDNASVISISNSTGVSIREVFALKEIAEGNKELREKYARVRSRDRRPIRDRKRKQDQSCCTDVPGVMPLRKKRKIVEKGIGKETDDELNADTLLEVADEVGL